MHRLLLTLLLAAGLACAQPPAPPPGVPGTGNELAAELPAEQVQWLQAAGARFLALYMREHSGFPQGAVLILPDEGQHPDWPGIVATLRRELPEHGWHSLSIALPLQQTPRPPARSLPPRGSSASTMQDAAPVSFEEAGTQPEEDAEQVAQARIRAALEFLRQQGIFNVVVVATGSSAPRAAAYLSTTPDGGTTGPSQGLVFIDARNRLLQNADTRLPALIPQFSMPVMDVVLGYEPGARAAAERRLAASRRLPAAQYTQVRLPTDRGASTYQQLVQRVRGWLKKHAAGQEMEAGATRRR